MRNIVTTTASALLVLLFAGSVSARHNLKGESKNIMTLADKMPIVQNMEYSKYFETDKYGGFGIGFDFEADVDLGYAFPIEYLYTNKDNILLNPSVYVEVASHSYMDIIFPFIEWRFTFDFIGYKFTIADYILLLDLHKKNSYCSGLTWI
jgi:hypothetical protein